MSEIKKPVAKLLYTPVGVAHYPHLISPDTKFIGANGIPAYKCKLVLQPGEELEKFQAQAREFFDAAIAAFIAENPKFKKTFKIKYDAFRTVVDDNGDETGEVEIVTKLNSLWKDKTTGKTAKQAPEIYDAKNKKIKPASIWGGSKLRLAVKPLFTSQGAEITLAWRLIAVQVIELVKGGSGGGVAFGETDGYSAEDDEEANGFGDGSTSDSTEGESSGEGDTGDEEF